MTDGDKQFPSQQQEGQPGREHEMHPSPEIVRSTYKSSDKLMGKIALITGGDSGIGRSVACYFAMEGATVAITYVPEIEERDASETLGLLKDKYKSSHAKDPMKIAVDLVSEENCAKVIQKVIDAYGLLDIVVNNAGEQHEVPKIENITAQQVERVFRTNIFSQFYITKLIQNPGVAPGPIWTPLIPASFPSEKVEQFGLEVPMKRASQPSEIGPSYVFLASEDSSYFTGQVLHPNGGVPVNG